MAEHQPTDAELDALVEAALREGPLVPAPRSLHGRVVERVQLAALEQKERARFRNALLSGFAACMGVMTAAVAIVASTNFEILLNHGVPGGLGFWDYYRTTFEVAWPIRFDGAILPASMALVALSLWAGLLVIGRQGMSHLLQAAREQGAMHERLLRTR